MMAQQMCRYYPSTEVKEYARCKECGIKARELH
jgi:hypothetical protein